MIVKVSKQIVQDVLKDFDKRFSSKRVEKGMNSFNSLAEIQGKLLEEFHESVVEMHNRDRKAYELELLDVAITALFGIMSMRANDVAKKSV
jgi:hypothetical protein